MDQGSSGGLLTLLCLSILAGGCIDVRQELAPVTPGTVPSEIRGARWPETPVTYCITLDEGGRLRRTQRLRSADAAGVRRLGIPAAFEGNCAGPPTNGNGVNEIGWGDLEVGSGNLTEAGKTNLSYRSKLLGGSPYIIDPDVTIHRVPVDGKATPECLYTTLLHEAGHILGVPHLGAGNVMSPVITDCLHSLTPADRAALDELY